MKIHFYKFEATGNDFIITNQDFIEEEQAKKLCANHYGIGADGLINIDQMNHVTIFNKDGSQAKMCGNGLRCLCAFLTQKSKEKKHVVLVNQMPIPLEMETSDMAKVWFLTPQWIKNKKNYFVQCQNNHYLFFVDDIKKHSFNEKHHLFSLKEKCNLHAVQILSQDHIQIKSYEYGVGETNSCGSGSISAFYLLRALKKVQNELIIQTDGGNLTAIYQDFNYYLRGPVHFIYKGETNNEF